MKNFILEKIHSHRNAIRNFSGLMFFNVLASGVMLFTNIKIANLVGKESFGSLAFAVAIGTYAAAFIRFGFNRTLVKDLIHDSDNYDSILSASVVLKFILAFIFFALLVLLNYFTGLLNLTFGQIMVIISYGIVSLDLQEAFDSRNQMVNHSALNLGYRLLYCSVIWLVILKQPAAVSINFIGTAMLAASAMFIILQYVKKSSHLNLVNNYSKKLLFSTFRTNAFLWVATILNLTFPSLSQIMLEKQTGKTELGVYAVSWQIVLIAGILLQQAARIGLPATARVTKAEKSKNARIKFMAKYMMLMLFISSFIAVPAIFFPSVIIKTLYSDQYLGAIPILRVFGFYILFFSFGIASAQYIISIGRNNFFFLTVTLCGIINICLNLLLVPSYKGFGAALALMISHGMAMILYLAAMFYNLVEKPEAASL